MLVGVLVGVEEGVFRRGKSGMVNETSNIFIDDQASHRLTLVGEELGDFDGLLEGPTLGLVDGTGDGPAVGELEGLEEGDELGDFDGLLEGPKVGVDVGVFSSGQE